MIRQIKSKTLVSALALSAAIGLSACAPAETPDTETEVATETTATPMSCEDLASIDLGYTVISGAEIVSAGAFTPPPAPGARPADFTGLPEYCRVTGSIQPTENSDIKFEAWLPLAENWNGRFMQVGNGGAAGSMAYASMIQPLTRGYAVVHTDTGHRGTMGDFTWALGEPEKLTDYQYRAAHETTLKGKDITSAFYGGGPERSYWFGCSTGGRQGLVEAQRFPEDYDAIIAGAPANNWEPLQLYSIHALNNLGPNGLPVSKLGVLKAGAVAACDAGDGLEDGIISDFGSCTFTPSQLQCSPGADEGACLTPDEAAAAENIYAGIVTSDGMTAMPGPGFGSEAEWAAYATPFFRIGTSYMQNVVLEDTSWDPATMEVDTHLPILEAHDQGRTAAMDPDLSAFLGQGGKLLMYHGMADGIIPYGNTRDYYESVVETMGSAADEGVQFFSVPGMGHCSGGDGASAIDWISAIEAWDETGDKPDQLEASHPDGRFTRPICEYPALVTYDGSGDENDAASFTCEM